MDKVFGSVFIGFSKREIPFSEVLSSFGNGWTSFGQHLATFGQQSTRFQPLRDAIPSILSATCPTLLQDHPHSFSPLAPTFSFPEETRGLLGPLVTYWHSLDRHQEPQHLHVTRQEGRAAAWTFGAPFPLPCAGHVFRPVDRPRSVTIACSRPAALFQQVTPKGSPIS